MTEKNTYISNEKQLQNHSLTFILKNQLASFSYQHSISFTHGLQHYRNLGQAKLAPIMWTLASVKTDLDEFLGPKMTPTTWKFKLKVFKREDKNAEFRLRQNLSMGEADFNQFIRQRSQLVVAADNFLREQNLSPVLQTTLSKDMEEQLKLVHEVIDVVDRSNRKICVTLLRYKVDNPQTSYAQVRLFGRKKEEEKFQQIVYVNYKLDEFVYLLDVMYSVYDKVIANQPICNVL